MGRYVLTLTEGQGELEFTTHHLIEAEDEQMVKYHFHRTLKDFGYTDTQYGGKHALDSWNIGASAAIHEIREVGFDEWRVLQRFMSNWTKI